MLAERGRRSQSVSIKAFDKRSTSFHAASSAVAGKDAGAPSNKLANFVNSQKSQDLIY